MSTLIDHARLFYADADGIALDIRAQTAQRIVTQFETALAAALESQASDAVQQVAANLGMTRWLLRDVLGNAVHADGTVDAVRWLAMSEWQALRNGGPLQSAWNAIALMRIARADTSHAALTLNDLHTQAGPFVEAFDTRYWPQRWANVAVLCLREHDDDRHRYGHVQMNGLLLELTWFAYVDGDHVTVRTAMNRLAQAMQGLTLHDHAYFVQALKQLTQMADAPP